MSYYSEYKSKLRAPREAVQVIKSGDGVEYTLSLAQPYLLDKALAARTEELTDIKVRGMYTMRPLKILEADPEQVYHIDEPVDPKILEQLRRIPEFVRAYEPDGMKPAEFITYGVTQKLLSQFNETGWAPLETYLSKRVSSRWI